MSRSNRRRKSLLVFSKTTEVARQQARRRRTARRLLVEPLEDRRLLATFAQSGADLVLDLGTAGEAVSSVANAGNYTLTLTGGTWSGGPLGGVTLDGTSTILTVTKDTFASLHFTDSVDNTRVTLNDSGANAYADGFSITLDQDPANPALVLDGSSSFGGNSISVDVATGIDFANGSSLTTTSGDMVMQANTADTATISFQGIQLDNATVESTSGTISLTGKGGTSGAGVRVVNGSRVSSDDGSIMVDGDGKSDDGVLISGMGTTVTSEDGAISITGTTTAIGSNAGVVIVGSDPIVQTTNAAPIHIIANGPSLGLRMDDAVSGSGAPQIRSAGGGDITISGGTVQLNNGSEINTAGVVRVAVAGDVVEDNSLAPALVPRITADQLGISATGNVDLQGENLVDTLAIDAGGTVDFNNTGALTIASVTASTPLLATRGISAPGDVRITTRDAAAAGQDLTVSTGVTVQSTGGNVTLRAGDNLSIPAGAVVDAAGAMTLAVDVDDVDTGNGDTLEVLGTLNSVAPASLLGGPDGDTINATPSTTTAYRIFGGDPTISPGDVLTFATPSGETATLTNPGPDSGTVQTTGGYQDVDFDEIEVLNFSGSMEVDGTDQDDLLVIDVAGPDSGTYQLTTDVDGSAGGPFVGPVVGMTGVTDLLFNSQAGNDTMRINHAAGGLFAPSGGIQYDAGLDDDRLEVLGGSGDSGRYDVGPDADQGTLVATGGGLTQTITFTGLEPILHTTTLATFQVNASSGADRINIIDGPTAGTAQTVEVNFDGAFELIRLANKAALNVNGQDGADTINVDYATDATGLATLTTDGGAGADTINLLQSSPVGVTTNLAGGADADTFDFTDDVLLTGNVDGNAGDDTLDLSAYTTPRSVQLTGIGATDGYAGSEAALSGSFTSIDQLTGPAADGDTLSGPDLNTAWDLSGGDRGSVTDGIAAITSPISGQVVMPERPGSGQDLAFSSFENLVGGADSDWFDLADGAGTTGSLDGSSGNDTLDYRDYTTAVNVELSAGTATNIAGNVVAGGTGSSIENVFGGSAVDTLTGDGDDNVLGDGLGSDVLSGGTGSDRYVLEPGGGSADELNETPATGMVDLDTVDFSLATAGVVLDMDLLGVPQDVFGGNTVQLNREAPAPAPSGFENFIGSDYADTVDIDPLAVIRSVEGNDPTTSPGDTLNFDAGGSIVIDNSTSLTAGGIGTVLYSEIETIDLFDVSPRIIDNGDMGWCFAGGWIAAGTEGYEGDFHYLPSGTVANMANWTFDGVTPGLYLVSATWPGRSDRASDATYTIKDGATPVGSPVTVDQQTDPTDFRDNGVFWQDLGLFNVDSHTLRVDLSGLGSGTVVADAIRIERINVGLPEIRVLDQDTLDNIADGTGVSLFGSTPVGTPITKTYAVQNLGTADLNLGSVTVPAGFTAGSFSQNPVPPGGMATVAVTMDAVAAGTYLGELSFGTDDRNENPFNFSLQGSADTPPAPGMIVDNDDPGFSVVAGTWKLNRWSLPYFQTDHRWHAPGTGTDVVQWEFTVTPGTVYRVSGTWAETWRRATNAPFTISDGVTTVTVQVDQGTLPADYPNSFTDQDADWADLVPAFAVDASSSTLTVQLSDDADGYLVADAIRIEERVAPEISVFDGTQEILSGSSVVDYGLTQVPLIKTFTVRNDGSGPLTLTEPIQLSLGFSLVSSFGSLTLQPTETTTFQVQLDAAAPGQVARTISFGNNDDNENPFVFSVTGTILGNIVDDHDPGWSVVSGDWEYSPREPGYYQQDHHYQAPGTGSDVVQWEFTGLLPGASYDLSATWTGDWNRASDAPYTITDGVSSVTVDMDQRTPPNDVSEDGAFFERLTVFQLDPGADSLTVQLSDDADGYVIADAVRLERTYLPEIEVTLDGALVTDGQSVIDYGDVLTGGPRSRTFTVSNTGDLPLILREPIVVSGSGFTTSGFGDDVLNPGETTTFAVTLTAAAAGTSQATLSFGSNDVDENPFEFDVIGNVVGSRIQDNRGPGWSIVSGTWQYNGRSAGYFQNTHDYSAPGTGGNVVQWEFTELDPGAVYQVSATWSGTWNRASDAPFTISDGVHSVTVDKDQGTPPNDFMDQGASWELLTTFAMHAGSDTLTIQLSDDADGYLIADAVRIVRVGSGMPGPAPAPAASALTVDQVFAESADASPAEASLPRAPAAVGRTEEQAARLAAVDQLLSDPDDDLLDLWGE